MQLSEFYSLLEQVFGRVYGRALSRDQVLHVLGDRTSHQALEDGVEPAVVWRELCNALEIPERERWLRDTRKNA